VCRTGLHDHTPFNVLFSPTNFQHTTSVKTLTRRSIVATVIAVTHENMQSVSVQEMNAPQQLPPGFKYTCFHCKHYVRPCELPVTTTRRYRDSELLGGCGVTDELLHSFGHPLCDEFAPLKPPKEDKSPWTPKTA
jgi:hypothetical protein